MAENTNDRRVQKTRKLLQDAFISLIAEKGFHAVTIQDLLDRANVGRSTFYLHFENKDELLHSCFDSFNNRLSEYYSELFRTALPGTDDAVYIAGYLRFVEKNRSFFRSLMSDHRVGMFQDGIKDYVCAYLQRIIKMRDGRKRLNAVNLDMLTQYVSNAFIGVLKWWVENDMPCSADELAQYLICQTVANIDRAMTT